MPCQVRHGMMLVGPTGGGKTNTYKALQAAMTSLAKEHEPESSFQKVRAAAFRGITGT